MINHSKYQDMLVCQKTTNLFIIFACGLVLLMCDCLFFLTTHVPERFLLFVWVCGLSVKKSKQGFIYLICQETLILQKMGVHIYVVVQFYPWFKFSFLLFLGMEMYDNDMIMSLKQKKRKFEPRIKLNHNIYM